MKKPNFKLVCLTLAVSALVTLTAKPVSADIMSLDIMPISYTLTLTELSSTNLQLAYTGPGGASSFSVINTGPDTWTIQVLSTSVYLNNFIYDFAEPEELNEVNEVSRNSANSPDIFVRSDLPIELDHDGYIGVTTTIGTDGGVPINLVFNDQAAAGEGVPDGGSTLVLLAFGMAALVGIRRIRIPQLAYSHR